MQSKEPSQRFNVLLVAAVTCQIFGLLLWYKMTDVGPALFRLMHGRASEITSTWSKSMLMGLLMICGGIWLDYIVIGRTRWPQTVQLVVYVLALPVALAVSWLVAMILGGGTFVARG